MSKITVHFHASFSIESEFTQAHKITPPALKQTDNTDTKTHTDKRVRTHAHTYQNTPYPDTRTHPHTYQNTHVNTRYERQRRLAHLRFSCLALTHHTSHNPENKTEHKDTNSSYHQVGDLCVFVETQIKQTIRA